MLNLCRRHRCTSTTTNKNRSLGQNFLTDEATLRAIVAAAGVTAADVVLEVGPGTGNLTRLLVATGAQVVAVEKDDVLVERLRKEFASSPNLELVHGDVLRVGIPGVIARMQERAEARRREAERAAARGGAGEGAGEGSGVDDGSAAEQQQQQPEASTSGRGSSDAASWRKRGSAGGAGSSAGGGALKVVANLPYNITKEFLVATLPLGGVVRELSIMVQHEVAERLCDPTPGRPDYRAMSVYTHYYSAPRYRLRIARTKYFPVPGVDGALVTFRLRGPGERQEVPSERGFNALVAKAFSERRKMMRNSMQPLYSSADVGAALAAVGLREDARAQDLNVEQFVRLHWELVRRAEAAKEGGDEGGSGGGGEASSGGGGSGGGGGGGSGGQPARARAKAASRKRSGGGGGGVIVSAADASVRQVASSDG